MPISWNEIRDRATKFARDWEKEKKESAEYQTFWNEFFDIFGIQRRSVSRYQEKVALLNGRTGFIDVFWPGTLIGEHKSAGENLNSAYKQAGDYFDALKESDKPRYILVTDYAKIRLYDLESPSGIEHKEFSLKDLPKHIRLFGFMAGYEERVFKDEDPINVKAVQKIAKLHQALVEKSYPPEALKKLLIRLVFLFFADDSGIFPKKDILKEYLTYMTREDGADFGGTLTTIFQILDTPEDKRQGGTDEELNKLPYVNGALFSENLPVVFSDRELHKAILEAMDFDWGGVSPAIFGSMFQSVMDQKARHDLGAHYTSEKNILKVINPLFMDELREEFNKAGKNLNKLLALQEKIARLKFLDPACGCGNFLVVAYKELRKLELEIIKIIYADQIEKSQQSLPVDIFTVSKLSVSQMHGIEIEEFPALIANLALWLTDHQMNAELGGLFGQYMPRLPLTESPHIVRGNALKLDWNEVVKKEEVSYIMGNPPFIAKHDRSSDQKEDVDYIFGKLKGAGELDYVACWYKKATTFIEGTNIEVGFVSTNSITQGEQVGILWPELLDRGIKINFAHRTFKWANEAKGNAGVYCVIVGFSLIERNKKQMFDYEKPTSEPHEILVHNINPYLVDALDIVVKIRRSPISKVPPMLYGSKPADGGFLILSDLAKQEFLEKWPEAHKYIKPLISAKEYLHGNKRWCLWLKNVEPEELNRFEGIRQKILGVKVFREASKKEATRKLAQTPYLFAEIRQPENDYVLIPRVTSENRKYIPLSFFLKENIVLDTCTCLPNGTLYHFGVLQSLMHMTWMRSVCGRLKSDYRYSNELVYNNFPWPDISEDSKKVIEEAGQNVLNARAEFKDSTLADLYNPLTMPVALLNAHKALDIAVDHAYRVKPFKSELERLEFLFEKYKELINEAF